MEFDNLFKGVYKGKRVLVTGHTGFKGSWLSLWLNQLGAEVLGYSLEPLTNPNLFNMCNIDKKITSVIGDIRDGEHLLNIFQEFKPEIVFHLAAQPLVRYSYSHPKLTYETNIMGTINVLEAVRQTDSVKVMVNVTTDKCYENKEWVYGYRENDPMGGYDPYSSSKGCSELVTSAYRNSFFNNSEVQIATARAGNVIGGGDWSEDRLIPDCVKSLSQDKNIVIRNPIATRPWEHVLEPLSGYLWLGAQMWQNKNKYNSAWNFGPGDENILSVGEIVKLCIKYWGGGTYSVDSSEQPHEATLLKLDVSKAHFNLGWKSTFTIEKAINKTIDWYKQFYIDSSDMESYTMSQIKEYVSEAKQRNIEWSL